MSTQDDSLEAHAPLVMVSGQVVGEHRLPINFVFRVEPNNQHDSGWNFWSGYELQKYIDDPSNLHICSLKIFLEDDTTLLKIIEEPVGSVFERSDGGDWYPSSRKVQR